ncbi:aminoglycoside 3-N-acetyltransferase [Candidatus Bathyarchaeota archaeon]|nr:MAG: aminoglycoside 3-N-acetyltransferase [Candidatus Bathyarchaeota archaeon]
MESKLPPITKSRLISDLKKLGVSPSDTIMLHASVKAIGWIVGGPDVVIQALLDVLGEEGTLMMYVGWEDSPWEASFSIAEWPEEWQKAYWEEFPPFNPVTSRANRKWSILTEYLRTWPGAYRSANPEASCAAVGAKAKWLTENHPLQYGYGPGSPLAKLCEAKGKVLLLGAPFSSITLLHHAEHLAKVPNKLVVRYKVPILQNGRKVWVEVEEFDTCGNVLPNTEEYFEAIPREFLTSGKMRSSKVGMAQSYLFDAAEFVEFAVKWLERKYANQPL